VSFHRLLSQTVEVTHRGPVTVEKDRYGTPIPAVAAIPVTYRGFLEEGPGVEIQIGRETVISNWTLVLPPEAVIAARDTVWFEGRVVGSPSSSPTARGEHHLSVALVEVEG
jgi:hypothetical protein